MPAFPPFHPGIILLLWSPGNRSGFVLDWACWIPYPGLSGGYVFYYYRSHSDYCPRTDLDPRANHSPHSYLYVRSDFHVSADQGSRSDVAGVSYNGIVPDM